MMISVIVPVYNVEKYLSECVKSICNQSYQDLEIILVDDGATDSSGELCDKLALEDNRIKVIHKQNGGLSDARNHGLEKVTGEFVCFIDSDDWIENETLERALNAVEKADVVIWGYYKDTVDENGMLISTSKHCSDALCNHSDGYKMLLQKNVLEQTGYAWNKLYRTEVLKTGGFQFEKGLSLIEDVVFNFPLFMQCKSIKYIDYLGTHYMQRPRTTLGSAYYPNRLEMKIRVAKLTKQLLLSFGASKEIANIHYGQNISVMLRSAIRIVASSNESYFVRRNNLKELLKTECCRQIRNNANPTTLKDKFVIAAAKMRFIDLLLMMGRR